MICWPSLELKQTWWTCLDRFRYDDNNLSDKRAFIIGLAIYFFQNTIIWSFGHITGQVLWWRWLLWRGENVIYLPKVAKGYLQLQQGYGANSRGIHKIWQVSHWNQLKRPKVVYRLPKGLGIGHPVLPEPMLWGAAEAATAAAAAATRIQSCWLLRRQEKATQSRFLMCRL